MSRKDKFNLSPPTLIEHLQSILKQYPPDGQILKELVQNADDAGATEIIFLLDYTQHGTDPRQFHHHEMVKHQGPALYAYNNAKFKDKDWESIGLLNRSLKEKDPLTVGRFGLGFKSVFHITDFPSLIAEDAVGFIDPHEQYFKTEEGNKKSCSLWDLANPDEISRFSQQFQPFKINLFGISEDTFAQGSYENQTLFRFPLRETPSQLSSTIFTPDDIYELFKSLESEAFSILLFLNSIEMIKVYYRRHGEMEKQLLCIEIAKNCYADVRNKRLEFRKRLEKAAHEEVSVSFPVVVEVTKYEKGCITSTQKKCWALSLYRSGAEDCNSARHLMDELKVNPIGGTAALLYTDDGLRKLAPDYHILSGRIFCFLPLPEERESPTGLNVHVNAYFALEQNRRHLKWPSPHQDNDKIKELASQWNVFLVEKVISKALINLILHLSQLRRRPTNSNAWLTEALDECWQSDDKPLQFAQLIYSVMPNIESVKSWWKMVEKPFYESLATHNVFYCPQSGSKWVNAVSKEVIFAKNSDRMKHSADAVTKVLRLNGLCLISVPDNVLRAICDQHKAVKPLTESVFCTYYKKLQNERIEFTEAERFAVLDYLCGQMTSDSHRNLLGLELIPLNDGSWTTIKVKQTQPAIYIPKEEPTYWMLPSLNHSFIRQNLTSTTKRRFVKLAENGNLNLAFLDPVDVVDLLHKVVGISDSREQVVQNNSREITYQWLNAIWIYMTNHGVDFCKSAEKWHFVPTDKSANQLAAFRKDAPLIVVWTREMREICKALGIATVSDLPSAILSHRNVRGNYILEEDEISALLKAIRTYFKSTKALFEICSKLRDSLKEWLQMEFCKSLQYGSASQDVAIMRFLPVFRTLPCKGTMQWQWDSAENVGTGTSEFSGDIPLTEKVLDLRDTVSSRLAERLNVRFLTAKEILLTYVIPGLKMGNYSDIESVMEAVLSKYGTTLLYDGEFVDQVKSVAFIKTASGKSDSPMKLYDHHDNLLKELFGSVSLIPAGKFAHIEYRDALRKLGLRQRADVTNEDILLVARKIDSQPHSIPQSTWKEFVKVLNGLAKRRQNLKFLEELKWVKPIYSSPGSSTRFPEAIFLHAESAKPLNALSSEFSSLVGCVRPLVNIEEIESLAEMFGWNAPPPVADVVKQLECIAKWFNESGKRAVCDLVSIRRLCEDIYGYLDKTLAKDSSEIIRSLQDKPCIFIEKCFLLPLRCAFESDLGFECLPLLCSLPESWTNNYPKFLPCVGIRKQFGLDDYLQALEELYNISQENDCPEMTSSNLKQALRILSFVKVNKNVSINKPAYLPDNTGKMRLASELCFSTTDAVSENLELCHPKVDHQVAMFLGAKSREQHILSSHLVGLEFGQKEELVDRIGRILTGYPMNENILKELVQNAEDAGASRIHFIIDARSLPDDRVFDERWKPLQRPALCVFNDGPFTEEDVVGIRSLGRGAKSNDGSKIGKFGVGFNCVYHLTDTPTFLCYMPNGERRLCAFDPMLKTVSKATASSPGYMFTDLNELKSMYPDVFLGYLENEYDAMGGTVFRFSLREKPSEISKEVVTVQRLRELFQVFKPELHKCLLFMKNVEEISLKEIGDKNEIREIYTVKMKLSEEANQKRKRVNEKYVLATKSRTGMSLEELDSIQTQEIYDLTTEDNAGLCQTWRIVHRMGLELIGTQSLPNSIQKAKASGNINVTPRGDLALRIASSQKPEKHLEKKRQMDGQLFNFLPLPVSLHLPIHVNGCFALDYENRRSLWSESLGGFKSDWNACLMKNLIAPAYCQLLLEMRPQMKDNEETAAIEDKLRSYRMLFPDYCSSEPDASYIEQMITAVYCYIASHNLELIPVYEKDMRSIKWVSLKGKPHFDHLCYSFEEETCIRTDGKPKPRKCDTMREILVESGFQLIVSCWNAGMEENFHRAKVEINFTTPESVLEFYKLSELTQRTYKLEETPFKTVDGVCVVLEYIKGHTELSKSLECLVYSPFLLTEDGLLQVFDINDRKFLSSYSKLLPHCSDQFINYRTSEILGLQTRRTKPITASQKKNSDSSDFKEETDICLHKPFNLTNFADMLPALLPKAQFCERDFCSLGELSDAFRRSSAIAFWQKTELPNPILDKEREKEPASWWLKRLWAFIAMEINAAANRGKEKTKPTEKPKDTLDCLKMWSLLPVVSSNRKEHLLSISNAKAVLVFNEMKDRIPKDLTAILMTIGVPQPNYSVLFGYSLDIRLMDYLFHTKQDASVAVVKAIGAGDYTGAVSNLQVNSKDCLLQFLALNGHQWIKNEAISISDRAALQRLPIYVSFAGNRISISDSSAYIVPRSVPQIGSRGWTNVHKPNIFLKTLDETNTTMLTVLNCKQLNLLDVYSRFIFEAFSLLGDEEIYAHMNFVKDNLLRQCKENKRHVFKGVKFLSKANDTTLLPAYFFFDSRNPVFKALEDTENFPPSRYSNKDWLDVLVEFFGLVEKVSIDKSLEYADKFADGLHENDLGKLETFVEHIASLEVKSFSELCRQLKCKSFLPVARVDKSVANLHCQKGLEDKSSPGVCCFENAVLFRHKQLVWSIRAVLPELVENVFHNKSVMLQELGVKLLPPVDEVIKHLQNVSEAIISRGGFLHQNEHETLNVVLKEIYQFLTEETKKQNIKDTPKQFPCITAEYQERCVLIPPNQAVMQIDDDIRPYLYKLPDDFVMFTELLRQWGVAESPTLQHYSGVLSAIYTKSREENVTPNDLDSFKTALRGLFKILDKQGRSSDLHDMKELFLLGEDGKLCNASNLIVCDNTKFADRLQSLDLNYMAGFQSLSLEISTERAEDLLRKLPKHIRPKFISECVREKRTEESETTIEFRNAIDLQNKLRGKWFKQGIFRLAKHNIGLSHEKEEVSDNELWSTLSLLDIIEVKGLDNIKTYLEYNGERVSGSERDVRYLVQDSVVYVTESSSSSETQDELYAMLTGEINNMCKGLLSNVTHFLITILNYDERRISNRLDNMNIRQCDPFKVVFIPACGEYVPPTMHCFLKQEGWDFTIGKLVAFEISDSIDSDGDLKDDVDYIFAEVVEKVKDEETGRNPRDTLFQRYKIRIGEGEEKTVSGTLLYGFCKSELLSSLPKDLVLSSLDMSAQAQKDLENLDVGRIRDQINAILDETKCSGRNATEKRRIVKRFYLEWHPLLNNPSYCNVFEEIANCIQQLCKVDDQQSKYFQFYDARADRYRAQASPEAQEPFSRALTSEPDLPSAEMPEANTEGRTMRPSMPPVLRSSYPRPDDARRFIKQAKHDLAAAVNDEGYENPSYEWACYKYHQGAEKALKAVNFLRNSEQLYIHHLGTLCSSLHVDTSSILESVRRLEALLPDHSAMRYPGYNRIPHDRFTEETAFDARRLAEKIVEWAEEKIESDTMPN